MPFIVYKGERKLADLIGRAYGEGLKVADTKRAEVALVAANPQLAKLRELSDGTLIVVPDLSGVATPRSDGSDVSRAALATARREFDEYRRRLSVRLDEDGNSINVSADLLKSREAKALAKAVPESVPYLERGVAALKARQAEAEERAAALKALARLRADFEELAKKLE